MGGQFIPGNINPGAMLDDFDAMKKALRSIADGPIDSGIGLGAADFWVTLNGTEYRITARVSNKGNGL